ncbi:hypothetical protein FUAX_31180 [Fulvitalea axinellae]|uniref:Major facilitator superfamily (MFS) profile domain-containing protein n=1 Tax=Fulvitalea axinellae TaxID=1182444 RepID=A0AAU9CEX5_9BACT|nr:hypothetical protein FUAX_31180 [Fulvitalea axinellae]
MKRPNPKKTALFVITYAIFIDTLIYSLIVPLLPDIATKFSLSTAQVNGLYVIYAAALIIFTPIAGFLSNKLGKRPVMLAGLAGMAFSSLLFAFVEGYPELMLARALQGISATVSWTAGLALISDYFPSEERGRATGIVYSGMSAGMLAGPPLAGFVYDHFGFEAPFIIAATLAVSDLLIRMFLLKDQKQEAPQKFSYRPLFRPDILGYLALIVVGSSMATVIEPVLPFFMRAKLGYSATQIGFAFGWLTVVTGIFYNISGRIADKRNKPRMIFGNLALTLISFSLLASVANTWVLLLILNAFGVFFSFFFVPILPHISSISEKYNANPAAVYAAFNLAYSSGMLFGPLSVFPLKELSTDATFPALAFLYSLAFLGISVFCFVIPKRKQVLASRAEKLGK